MAYSLARCYPDEVDALPQVRPCRRVLSPSGWRYQERVRPPDLAGSRQFEIHIPLPFLRAGAFLAQSSASPRAEKFLGRQVMEIFVLKCNPPASLSGLAPEAPRPLPASERRLCHIGRLAATYPRMIRRGRRGRPTRPTSEADEAAEPDEGSPVARRGRRGRWAGDRSGRPGRVGPGRGVASAEPPTHNEVPR